MPRQGSNNFTNNFKPKFSLLFVNLPTLQWGMTCTLSSSIYVLYILFKNHLTKSTNNIFAEISPIENIPVHVSGIYILSFIL